MQFEVPQFIEIEDKIFGPFTWKQFVYLLGGAGAVFLLYITLPFTLFVLIGGPIAGLSAALAFYQHNNRPFIFLLESYARYVLGAKRYLLKKQTQPVARKQSATKASYLPPSSSSLASLSRQLEVNALQNKR